MILIKETDGSYTLRITERADIDGIDHQVARVGFAVVQNVIGDQVRRWVGVRFIDQAAEKQSRYDRLSPAERAQVDNILGRVAPSIASITPPSGAVGTSVTIAGLRFGPNQGTSTVTFNGILATPTDWSPTSIVVPVPAGAATGPVVVTVDGVASNAVAFTVI